MFKYSVKYNLVTLFLTRSTNLNGINMNVSIHQIEYRPRYKIIKGRVMR